MAKSIPHFYFIMFIGGMFDLAFTDNLYAEVLDRANVARGPNGQDTLYYFYQKPEYPRDCNEVLHSCSSSVSSGVYLIKPDGYKDPFEAYCDNDADSGGWTVIQRRFGGLVDFQRSWADYKNGFGFLSTEFWLGNDKLSFLTNQAKYEIRIDITLENGTSCEIKHDVFRISDEWSNYTITTVGNLQSYEACKWKEDENEMIEDFSNFTDCNDVYNAGHTSDGVYSIRPTGWTGLPFDVFCNMSIDGGQWIVFQRRVNGSTYFTKNWAEYKEGFGDMQHEFWLGNEKLHHITNQSTYEYRLDFVYESSSYYNKYSIFRIADETNKYKATDVGSRSGTRGKTLDYTLDIEFSTYDQDNDKRSYNCAGGHRGGWWYGGNYYAYSYNPYCYVFHSGSKYVYCTHANLNGDFNGGYGENIFDQYYYYYYCNMQYTEMKIRRIS